MPESSSSLIFSVAQAPRSLVLLLCTATKAFPIHFITAEMTIFELVCGKEAHGTSSNLQLAAAKALRNTHLHDAMMSIDLTASGGSCKH